MIIELSGKIKRNKITTLKVFNYLLVKIIKTKQIKMNFFFNIKQPSK